VILFDALYKVVCFNFAQFYLSVCDQKQLIVKKYTCYLHLEHYIPKNNLYKLPKSVKILSKEHRKPRRIVDASVK